MKRMLKRFSISVLCMFCLLACNLSDELVCSINEEPQLHSMKQIANTTSNLLMFDSIAQADALLEHMRSIDNSAVFYNRFIRSSSVNNKYLNSIYQYLRIIENIERGDSVTAMSLYQQHQRRLLNVYRDGSSTVVEPLALYDYRCFVNDDNYFVAGDRVYHLFDSLFITCPIERHDELIEIANSPENVIALIRQIETNRIPDSLQITRDNNPNDDIFDLEYIYLYEFTSGIHELHYEKIQNNYRMQVYIYADEHYRRFYNRHDLLSGYSIKSHKKWAGLWWIQNERLNIDIDYLVRYALFARTLYLDVDYTHVATGLYPSKKKVQSHSMTHLFIHNYGIENVNFSISNSHMTITNADSQF